MVRKHHAIYKAALTSQLYLVRAPNALVVKKIVRDVVNTDKIWWRMFNTTQCWNAVLSKTKERAYINWKHNVQAQALIINMTIVYESWDDTKRYNDMSVKLKQCIRYDIHVHVHKNLQLHFERHGIWQQIHRILNDTEHDNMILLQTRWKCNKARLHLIPVIKSLS